jgi:ADP-heptose:LPS heptosyltransferase
MKIIIPVLHRFGDMILTTPMFRSIKNQFPNAEISVICANDNSDILQNNPLIHRIFIFKKSPFALIKLLISHRFTKYDYLIDPKDHYSSESQLLAKSIKANKKIGFNKIGKNTFDIEIPHESENSSLHFVKRCNQILSKINIMEKSFSEMPELYPNPESDLIVKNRFANFNKKRNILINLSAGKPNRKLSKEKWLKILEVIPYNLNIIVTAEKIDYEIAEEIANSNQNASFIKSKNFDELISLVKYSDIIITSDTSVVHIASAFNKPILAFYNGTTQNTAKFAPLSDVQILISAPEGEDSVEEIKIENIINGVKQIIDA